MPRFNLLPVAALTASATLAASGCTSAGGPVDSTFAQTPEWRLAVMAYTFNRFTFFEAVEKTRSVGGRYIEGFSWQKVSPDMPDVELNPKAPPEAIARVKARLVDSGVKLIGYYFHALDRNEAEARAVCAFCRDVGVEYIVCEPEPRNLDLCERLADEYGINVAIHNHPRDPKHPEYLNWNPDEVLKTVQGRGKRIGMCADTGHWLRSGLDPVECIRKYRGRTLTLHLKDTNTTGPEAHDVVWGTGVGNVKGVLAELRRQNFSGVFAVEYEHNMENNVADVAACMRYFSAVARELGLRGF